MPSYEIKQREQEDPDDVDKVPVQAEQFHRRIVVGGEAGRSGSELEARRTMIRSLREDAARAEELQSQLEAKRETIEMLEDSIDQHVQTITELRKSADGWKLKYLAVKGVPVAEIEETLTEQPKFTDTEIHALREFDPNADEASDKTVAIDMRDVLEAVRAQKAQQAQSRK